MDKLKVGDFYEMPDGSFVKVVKVEPWLGTGYTATAYEVETIGGLPTPMYKTDGNENLLPAHTLSSTF